MKTESFIFLHIQHLSNLTLQFISDGDKRVRERSDQPEEGGMPHNSGGDCTRQGAF